MNCRICNSPTESIGTHLLLNRYQVTYGDCPNCGYLQTETPYWLEEAYTQSINVADTGILQRNYYLMKVTLNVLFVFYSLQAKVLDFAGGYGILTRLLRDYGIDCYWSDQHSQNLVARGFEYNPKTKIDLITSFETFEHFLYPTQELVKMLEISSTVLLSTRLVPEPRPALGTWWYYAHSHGQHIGFYRPRTFEYLAKTFNLRYYRHENIHLLTTKKVSPALFNLVCFLSRSSISLFWRRFFLKSKTESDMIRVENLPIAPK